MFPRWTRIAVRSGFWLLVCFVAQTPALHAYVDYRQRVIFLGVSAPWWDSVSVSSLVTVLEDPVSINGRQLNVSASVGIATYPADGANATQLKRHADQAMYRAKSNGGRQIAFWPERRSLEEKPLGIPTKVL